MSAATGYPAWGTLNGLILRAAPRALEGSELESRATQGGAHTSVHHTPGVHVLHSAAQLHEVLPHSPLRDKPLLLLEVLWSDRQTGLDEHISSKGGMVITPAKAEQTVRGWGVVSAPLFSPAGLG